MKIESTLYSTYGESRPGGGGGGGNSSMKMPGCVCFWGSENVLFSSSASATAITRSRKVASTAGARRSAASCFFEIDGIDLWRRPTSTSIPPCCSVISLTSPDRLISLNSGPRHFFPVGGKCDIPCVALSDRLTRFLAYKPYLINLSHAQNFKSLDVCPARSKEQLNLERGCQIK